MNEYLLESIGIKQNPSNEMSSCKNKNKPK